MQTWKNRHERLCVYRMDDECTVLYKNMISLRWTSWDVCKICFRWLAASAYIYVNATMRTNEVKNSKGVHKYLYHVHTRVALSISSTILVKLDYVSTSSPFISWVSRLLDSINLFIWTLFIYRRKRRVTFEHTYNAGAMLRHVCAYRGRRHCQLRRTAQKYI